MTAKIESLECDECVGGRVEIRCCPKIEMGPCDDCNGTGFRDYRLTEEAREKIVEVLLISKEVLHNDFVKPDTRFRNFNDIVSRLGLCEEMCNKALALLQPEEK